MDAGWSRVKIPWAMDVRSLTSDGHGGLWLTGSDMSGPNDTNSFYVVHRTAAGAFSRIKLGSSLDLTSLAVIPGTTSVWGGGVASARTEGGNAVIWADGKV